MKNVTVCICIVLVENFIFPAKMGRCMHRSIFVNMVCCGQLNILFYYDCMWRIPQRRVHFSKDFSTIVVSLVSVNIWQCQCNGDVYKHLLKYITLKNRTRKSLDDWNIHSINLFESFEWIDQFLNQYCHLANTVDKHKVEDTSIITISFKHSTNLNKCNFKIHLFKRIPRQIFEPFFSYFYWFGE